MDIHDTMPETYAAKFGDDHKKNDSDDGSKEDGGGRPGLAFKLFCLEEALCCKFAHKIICVNHTQKDVLVERGIPGHKISVSLNVPDHRRFSPNGQGSRAAETSSAFNVVYHGTLARRLGIDLVVHQRQ